MYMNQQIPRGIGDGIAELGGIAELRIGIVELGTGIGDGSLLSTKLVKR